MAARGRAAAAVDVNAVEGEDTGLLGNQSPKFEILSPEEELDLIMNDPPAELASLPDHALDLAPENSKIVVVKASERNGRLAVLATPDGPQKLPENDPAHLLPEGSKIYKVAEGCYEARLPEPYNTEKRELAVRAAELVAAVNARIQGRPE